MSKLIQAIGLLIEHFEECGKEVSAAGVAEYMDMRRDGAPVGSFEVALRRTDLPLDSGDIANIFRHLGTAIQSIRDEGERAKGVH